MPFIRFSLITGTLGRTEELEKLLASLMLQGCCNYELIIVDQNSDNRLAPILARWVQDMSIKTRGEFLPEQLLHLRCDPGLSKARNVGLRACRGEIVAFPDDDCWYPPDTLRNVDEWFSNHQAYDILSLTSRDETGLRTANRWRADECDLAPVNIFRTSASFTFFVKRTPLTRRFQFDEALGIGSGTPFGSAEDTDFLLGLMKQGARGRFYSAWHIGHPRKDVLGGSLTVERCFNYGRGMGRVLGKYSMLWIWLSFMAFDVLRAGAVLLMGKTKQASSWFAHGKGLMSAYFARHPSIGLQAAPEKDLS